VRRVKIEQIDADTYYVTQVYHISADELADELEYFRHYKMHGKKELGQWWIYNEGREDENRSGESDSVH
jgi:hypothetical protein